MAERTYHILYETPNGQAWICPSSVGRHQVNDPLELPTPNHFQTRAAANDYIRRRNWMAGRRHRVEQCTWGEPGGCQRNHLPEWLEAQDPDEVDAWRERRRELAQAKSARRRERAAARRAAFEAAVAAEVARRLAALEAA